ncbi:hypothetical protein DICPUDRAFT_152369 [Dictyostelium purpureum]|uniref:Uncharacterized protein n=1 Tax=Dictyostelium purpureum TaxID=5786 RepID=F0ZL64_DICPU|nr:uncharacterized protein DICPUDRAFT_152369 [Dictyostelium purpureum]EGC35291.1 hypothetical protein DICPUDRAFT_152369 [Dictyostelium purpureum]|eukprot:XP_003288158.1 hypothetical protein DICPUDRAFT_152369 [Dictyostelium purpureum]
MVISFFQLYRKVKDNFVSDSSSELNVVAGDGSENSAFCGNATVYKNRSAAVIDIKSDH